MIRKLTIILSCAFALSFPANYVWAQGYLQNMAEGDSAFSDQDYAKAANMYRSAVQQITDGGGYTDDPMAIALVDKLGLALYRMGNYSEAESTFERERMLLEQAEQRAKTFQSPSKPARGTKAYCLSHLGDVRFANHNYSLAKENYQDVLELLTPAPVDYGLNALADRATRQIRVCDQKLHH